MCEENGGVERWKGKGRGKMEVLVMERRKYLRGGGGGG